MSIHTFNANADPTQTGAGASWTGILNILLAGSASALVALNGPTSRLLFSSFAAPATLPPADAVISSMKVKASMSRNLVGSYKMNSVLYSGGSAVGNLRAASANLPVGSPSQQVIGGTASDWGVADAGGNGLTTANMGALAIACDATGTGLAATISFDSPVSYDIHAKIADVLADPTGQPVSMPAGTHKYAWHPNPAIGYTIFASYFEDTDPILGTLRKWVNSTRPNGVNNGPVSWANWESRNSTLRTNETNEDAL